jgi:hypothetical protein
MGKHGGQSGEWAHDRSDGIGLGGRGRSGEKEDTWQKGEGDG